MKKKLIYLIIIITALLTSGCSKNANQKNDQLSKPNSANTQQSTTQSQTTAETNTGNTATMISEEDARRIALEHANLTAEQVTFIKSGLDRDNGRVTYDVEFYTSDNKEFDYEIDPYTGEILDYDYDAEYFHQNSDTIEGEEISASKAKEIALAQVPGATENNIHEFESDYDNGKLRYEGKIFYEQAEYEFEIDGQSGTILEWNVEAIHNGTP